MSVPRLSFRQPPLKLTLKKTKQVKLVKQVKPVKHDIESLAPVETPKTNKNIIFLFVIVTLLVLMRMLRYRNHSVHTIKKLKCRQNKRKISCYGAEPVGTFVIQLPKTCAGSVYDIGGYPFSVASQGDFFKVPAKELTVRDINGNCEAKAYIDSNPITMALPFTWVTTNQHTVFTIMDGHDIIVDKASAAMFNSVTRGPWIAYTYDIPGKTASVVGDGTDIIHVYNGVSGRR